MGNSFERNILFMGLANAGSTQLLYSLKLLRSPDMSFKPSNGFNYEAIDCINNESTTQRYKLHIFDLPGNENLRCVWEHFYRNMNVDVMCFIVDASDRSAAKLEEVKRTFSMLCNEETLKPAAKLIVLNQKKNSTKGKFISKAEILRLLGPEYGKATTIVTVDAKSGKNLQALKKLLCTGKGTKGGE